MLELSNVQIVKQLIIEI